MKLKLSCFAIFILFVSAVDCGLVKQFLGNVKEDVHEVVDNTLNIIGIKTHKIKEGLGVFLHLNESNTFPGHQSVTVRPNNQLPNGNNKDNSNKHNPTNNKSEENTGQTTPVNDNEYNKFPEHQSVTPTNQIYNDDKIDSIDGLTDNKHEENINDLNENNLQHYNPIKPTPATGNVPVQNAHIKPTTELNINKNVQHETTTNRVIVQPETTSYKIIHEETTKLTATSTNVATTTEADSWLTGVELENILPIIMQNYTLFSGNKNTVNADIDTYTNTNELGTGDNLLNKTNEESHKKAKLDESETTGSETNVDKANLLSDQMFFNDNKPKPKESSHYICAKPLVRAANGDCLEPIEIDVRKKNEPRTFNVFQAEGCASGYARAQDNTCQKIIG